MVTQPAHHARAIKAILPTSPLVTSPQPHAASQPCRRALIQDSCPVAVAGIWIWTSIMRPRECESNYLGTLRSKTQRLGPRPPYRAFVGLRNPRYGLKRVLRIFGIVCVKYGFIGLKELYEDGLAGRFQNSDESSVWSNGGDAHVPRGVGLVDPQAGRPAGGRRTGTGTTHPPHLHLGCWDERRSTRHLAELPARARRRAKGSERGSVTNYVFKGASTAPVLSCTGDGEQQRAHRPQAEQQDGCGGRQVHREHGEGECLGLV
jgi:hypothetical protein